MLKCLPSFLDQTTEAYLSQNPAEMLYICRRYSVKILAETLKGHILGAFKSLKFDSDSSLVSILLKIVCSTVINFTWHA